jgi:hypothetical protein
MLTDQGQPLGQKDIEKVYSALQALEELKDTPRAVVQATKIRKALEKVIKRCKKIGILEDEKLHIIARATELLKIYDKSDSIDSIEDESKAEQNLQSLKPSVVDLIQDAPATTHSHLVIDLTGEETTSESEVSSQMVRTSQLLSTPEPKGRKRAYRITSSANSSLDPKKRRRRATTSLSQHLDNEITCISGLIPVLDTMCRTAERELEEAKRQGDILLQENAKGQKLIKRRLHDLTRMKDHLQAWGAEE